MRRILLSPVTLIIGFVLVHIWGAYLILQRMPITDPGNDIYLYSWWAYSKFPEGDSSKSPPPAWVYPIAALAPMWFAYVLGGSGAYTGAPNGAGNFTSAWMVMLTVLDAIAMIFIVLWGRTGFRFTYTGRRSKARHLFPPWSRQDWLWGEKYRQGIIGAWCWLIFTAILAWLNFSRVEGVTAPIVIVALVLGLATPLATSIILSIATWMKLWPAAILVPLFTAAKNRWKVVTGAGVVCASIVIIAAALGVLPRIFYFLSTQGTRGMQVEAVFSTPWVWMWNLKIGGAAVGYNQAINTNEVFGPGTEFTARLMQPLFILVAATVAGIIFWALRRSKAISDIARDQLFFDGSLAMVTAFIVFNKVGSPQFMLWLGPVIAVGLARFGRTWRYPAILSLIIAIATIIFPLNYTSFVDGNITITAVLTVRNLLLIMLFIWSMNRLVQMIRQPQSHQASLSRQEPRIHQTPENGPAPAVFWDRSTTDTQ